MKRVTVPISLQVNESTEFSLRIEAMKAFTDCPRLKLVTSDSTLCLKLPVTFLRFSRPIGDISFEELLSSLEGDETSSEFSGLNPAYKSLATLGEGLRFDGCFGVITGSKVPGLGRTGLLVTAEVIGKLVLCKVVLRPDASGGVVTALSQSVKLRKEVLSLILALLARPSHTS